MHVKTLFSYFQQLSLPKVHKTCLRADFVTNNQILVVKIIKTRGGGGWGGGGGGTKSFIAESKSVAHFSCWMIFLTIKALSGTKLSNENEKAYLVDFSFWTDGNQCSGNFQILLNQGTFKFHKDVNNAYEYLVNILFWSRYASTIGNQFHKLQE